MRYSIDGQVLTDIADAINAKTGGTSALAPGDMADEIDSIPSGGGGVTRWIDVVNFQSDFSIGDMYPLIMANQYSGLVAYIQGLYSDLDSTTCDHVATAFCVLLYVAAGDGWSQSERVAAATDIRNLPAQSSFMSWVATTTCLAQCDAYKALFA